MYRAVNYYGTNLIIWEPHLMPTHQKKDPWAELESKLIIPKPPKNARTTMELAAQFGISDTAVRMRMKHLPQFEHGYFRGPRNALSLYYWPKESK